MKRNIFVFDVESTSLHGKGFAVGVIVLDCATHKQVDSFELKSLEGEKGCSDWVKENNFNLINLDYHYNNSNYQKINKTEQTEEVLITNY